MNVDFNLWEDFYGNNVKLDDRFETEHIWSYELAIKNKGRWTPICI